MRNPRWLKVALAEYLTELDMKFMDKGRSGPITIEIHYRSGAPMVAKIRTEPMPPPVMEFRLCAAATSF